MGQRVSFSIVCCGGEAVSLLTTTHFCLKDPGFCVVFLAFFAAKQKQRFFRVFRKPKIRKLHIFTFFMNFDIFSKFLVLTRVGTLNLKNTRSMVVLTRVLTVPTRVGTLRPGSEP